MLCMRGTVRLDNNGGFIQARLPLAADGAYDASRWDGIRFELRGVPGPYFVHLRTADTRQPWAYYRAPLPVQEDWQTVDIPFSAFRPQRLHSALDLTTLQTLGLVAYGEAFAAELEVARIEWV
jgi:hypothetical protein